MRLASNSRFWILLLLLISTAIALSLTWTDLMVGIVTQQQALHERLAVHIREINAAPWRVGGSLMVLSLFYGVFHAAGPGHGKAVLVTYLATQKENIRQSVAIAVAAAMVQASVAVGLISIIALVLGWTFSDTQQLGTQVQLGSYALVILLGLYITIQALRRLWSRNHEHCQHTPEVPETLNLRQTSALVLSMGLRPCSGALLVLIYAHLVGVYWFGVASTFMMAVGTALTVSIIAIASVVLRDRMTSTLSDSVHKDHHHHHHQHDHSSRSHWIRLAGGGVLLILGISLLVSGWSVGQDHPLF